jgi:hypothetical protein
MNILPKALHGKQEKDKDRNPSVSGGTHHIEHRGLGEESEEELTQRREDAKGELVEYGTVKAMNSVQPSARKMLQVLHALHGAVLLLFCLAPMSP